MENDEISLCDLFSIIFKDINDRIVEIKTQTPIDYMIREYNEL